MPAGQVAGRFKLETLGRRPMHIIPQTKSLLGLSKTGDKTGDFYAHLWRGGNFAFIETVLNGKRLTHWFKTERGTPRLPERAEHAEKTYFSLHPGDVRKDEYHKFKASDISAINALFAEFDAAGRDFPNKAAALAHIETFAIQPSVIIDSGGGYHCYWLLAETVKITDENRDYIKRVIAAWVGLVGGDDSAKLITQCPRVPGTVNRKEKYAPDYPTVEFVRCDLGQLYDFDALAGACKAHMPAPRAKRRRVKFTPSTDDITQTGLDIVRDKTAAYASRSAGNRERGLYGVTRKIASYAIRHNIPYELVKSAMLDAAETNGIAHEYSQAQIERKIHEGWEQGLSEALPKHEKRPDQRRHAADRRQSDGKTPVDSPKNAESAPDASAPDTTDTTDEQAYWQWWESEVIARASAPASAEIVTFNTRYVSDAPVWFDRDRMVIKSPMNTGKTEFIKALVRGKRALIINHRQRLSLELTDRLNDDKHSPGAAAECYLDISDSSLLRAVDVLVICANSLHRLKDENGNMPAYDVIVIEESESTFEHIVGRTFDALQCVEVVGDLRALFAENQRAKGQLVAMDANAGQLTDMVMTMLAGAPPVWFVNVFKLDKGEIELYENADLVTAIADKALGAGEAVYCPRDSQKAVRQYCTTLNERAIEPAEIRQDKKLSGEQMRKLDEYQAIVSSPSLDAGVELNAPRTVAGVFIGGQNSVPSILQQLGRARTPTRIAVYFQNYHSNQNDQNARRTAHHSRLINAKILKHVIRLPNTNVVHPDQKIAMDIIAFITAREALHQRDRRRAFVVLAELAGYTVKDATPDASTQTAADIAKMDRKDAAQAIAAADRHALLNEKPIDDKAWHAIQRAGVHITDEARQGRRRFQVEQIFAAPISEEIANTAEKYDVIATVPKLVNLLRDTEELTAIDYEQAAQVSTRGSAPAWDKLKYRSAHKRLFVHLMQSAGFSGDCFSWQWTKTDLEQSGLIDAIERSRGEVYRVMGIRARQFDSEAPAHNMLRTILKTIGLKIERIDRTDQYRIAPDCAIMFDLAHNYAKARNISLQKMALNYIEPKIAAPKVAA